MASPKLQYDKLTTLASQGGYSENPHLSQLSAVLLLSACWVLREKWLWQKPIDPITDVTYQNIVEMIEQCESDLMTQYAIGSIVPSICPLNGSNLLLLDGSSVLQSDYPVLASCVPPSWLVGANIDLPDMNDAGLFGTDDSLEVGQFVGENDVTLTESEMPTHTHIQDPHQHSELTVNSIPTAAGLEPAFASLVNVVPTVTGLTAAINQSAGGGGSHNNIQNSMQVYYYIVGG